MLFIFAIYLSERNIFCSPFYLFWSKKKLFENDMTAWKCYKHEKN